MLGVITHPSLSFTVLSSLKEDGITAAFESDDGSTDAVLNFFPQHGQKEIEFPQLSQQ